MLSDTETYRYEPIGCPTSQQLYLAWKSYPGAATVVGNGQIHGFDKIKCWGDWVVAAPQGRSSGHLVFSLNGGLHGATGPELDQMRQQLCSGPGAPAGFWNLPAQSCV
jgi:hypothetical protein